MTDSSAQFRPVKDGNYVLGVRGLHFLALSPLAARALILPASIPKSTRAAGAFLSFAFDCFKGPGEAAQGTRGTGGFFARSKPQGLVYRSACDIRVVGVTV